MIQSVSEVYYFLSSTFIYSAIWTGRQVAFMNHIVAGVVCHTIFHVCLFVPGAKFGLLGLFLNCRMQYSDLKNKMKLFVMASSIFIVCADYIQPLTSSLECVRRSPVKLLNKQVSS